MSPAFSPSIHDYAVHCTTGTNSITLGLTAAPGGSVALSAPFTTAPACSATVTVGLNENQAAVVQATDANAVSEQYWIRCLPHDFPFLSAVTHPEAGSPTPGWYVMGNPFVASGSASYAMIVDANGTPVWYHRPAIGTAAGAVAVEPFPADTVAVLPNLGPGFGTNLTGSARLYHLDTWTKESVVTVGMPIDQHEILSLPNGDRMALSYPLRSGIDLTGLPNCNITQPSTAIADCAVQELDPAGNLVWQWRASDHIDPVLESTTQGTTTVNICSGGSAPDANCQGNCSGGGTCTGAGNTCVGGTNPGTVCCPGGGTCSGQKVCDVYHCNSIDVNAAGDVLVSARHTDSVFLIKRATGQCPAGGDCIVWKLGSTRPNTDGAQILTILNDPQTTFYRQHDARFRPNGNISVFDDHGAGLSTAKARGVEYQLDLGAGTAQPVWQYLGDAKSNAGGSARRYPDGHSVIDWGLSSSTSNVAFTEIDDASGLDVLDLSFASHGNWGYRAVKVPLDAFDITRLRNTAGLPEP